MRAKLNKLGKSLSGEKRAKEDDGGIPIEIVIHDTHNQRDKSKYTQKTLIYDKFKKEWVEKEENSINRQKTV
jgi:hypothetical protein